MPGPIREPAPEHSQSGKSAESADKALALMIEALELLDLDGANIAGAHLDLAIHRLREWIDKEGD
jgi:hypothetical protein